jgi:UDP-glucuronate 4-epimerase
MRIVVTGAAGFVGAHLTNKLLREGHQVLAIDNFSDYYSTELKKLRVSELISSMGGRVFSLDLVDIHDLKNEIESFQPSGVVHLAAQPGVRLKTSDYHKYARDNILAFSNLFQVILELGIKNFLYASSSSVYGDSSEQVLSEGLSNITPVSYYGATKLCNEILASTSLGVEGMSAVGLRFFTVYGPYGRPDMAYFRLISNILTPYQFELYGDGSVRRDFTYVDDTVNAIYLLIQNQLRGELVGNAVYNIGGGKPASMLEMISELEILSGAEISYGKAHAHIGDVRSTNANTSKLNTAINFVPRIELKDGLERTLRWSSRTDIVTKLEKWSNSVA